MLKLDAALFDIPAGMTQAADAQQLAKAISDANEARLAQGELRSAVPATRSRERCASASLKSRTRRRRRSTRARCASRLVAELEEQKIDVIPMAAAPQAALNARANESCGSITC